MKVIILFILMIFSLNIHGKNYEDLKQTVEILEKEFNSSEEFANKIKNLEKELIEHYEDYSDEEIIDAYLLFIDFYFYNYDMESAHQINEKIKILSKKNNNYKIEFYYLQNGIFIDEFESDLDKTLENYKKAIKYGLIHENNFVLTKTYTYTGDIYSMLSEISPALENYKKAENYAETPDEIFDIKFGVMTLYYYFGIFDLAIEQANYIEKYLNLYEEMNFDKEYYLSLLYNIKMASYSKIKDFDNALKYSIKMKELSSEEEYPEEEMTRKNSIAMTYLQKGEIDKARMFMAEIDNLMKNNKPQNITKINNDILKYYYYFQIKKYEQAYEYLSNVTKFMYNKESAFLNDMNKRMAELLSLLGRHEEALEYQKKFNENFIKIREDKELSLSIFLFENYKEVNLVNNNKLLEEKKLKKEKMLTETMKENLQNYFKLIMIQIGTVAFLICSIIFSIMYYKNNKLSNQEDLTKGYNRRYTFNYLEKIIRDKKNFQLGVIDIDRFKAINDTYGHEIGDQAIIEVYEKIKSIIHKKDLVSRIGGEEYMIVCRDDKFEEIREEIEKSKFTNKNIKITISTGVVKSEKRLSADQLYKIADEQLYKAKEYGRNRVMKKLL